MGNRPEVCCRMEFIDDDDRLAEFCDIRDDVLAGDMSEEEATAQRAQMTPHEADVLRQCIWRRLKGRCLLPS